MKISNFLKYAVVFLGLTIFLFSCRKDNDVAENNFALVSEFNHEVPLAWNELFLEIERYAAGYIPGPAPRALGHMGLAVYEACITGMPEYNSLKNRYAGLELPAVENDKEYYWPAVVHGVYSSMMPRFFPNTASNLDSKMKLLIKRFNEELKEEAGNDVFNRSLLHGQKVGDAVWQWSSTDSYAHDAYLDPFKNYDWAQAFRRDGDWVPTVPGPPQPMYPHWGKVRTFAIPEEMKLSRPPLAYSESPTSALYAQAIEVYANHRASFEGQWIGEFWSNDFLNVTFSPGPRWVAIANQIIVNENSNLETSIEAYAKVGMATSDAAVACWHSKYHYNVERPESYIKRVIDPNWEPSLNNPSNGDEGFTPPFPAYPSGHSTMGAAGAEALASVFGYAYSMTDRCHENRTDFLGMPRTFGSLYEMGLENAWSRVPLGVHFRMDSEEGVRHGTVIGRAVNNLPWKK